MTFGYGLKLIYRSTKYIAYNDIFVKDSSDIFHLWFFNYSILVMFVFITFDIIYRK